MTQNPQSSPLRSGLPLDENVTVGPHTLKSLLKVVEILECFSIMDRQLSVTEIAQRTGIPKSTVHRLIDSAKVVGLLDQDGNRERYRLGLKLFELGSTVLMNMDLVPEARPFVESLAKLSGENVHLGVFDGTHVVFVEKTARASSVHNTLITMESSPSYCTGVGKAVLAYQSKTVIDKVIRLGLKPLTRHTIIDPLQLHEELSLIRQRGVAIDNCEHSLSVRCIAAPIRNAAGRVFAAISASGAARRMSDEKIASLTDLVISHAASISICMGYQGD